MYIIYSRRLEKRYNKRYERLIFHHSRTGNTLPCLLYLSLKLWNCWTGLFPQVTDICMFSVLSDQYSYLGQQNNTTVHLQSATAHRRWCHFIRSTKKHTGCSVHFDWNKPFRYAASSVLAPRNFSGRSASLKELALCWKSDTQWVIVNFFHLTKTAKHYHC